MEKSLKDLLSRLPLPGLKESTDRHSIAEVLSKVLSVPIRPKQVLFKDGIVTVSVPPVVKSALQLHQGELCDELSKQGIQVVRFR